MKLNKILLIFFIVLSFSLLAGCEKIKTTSDAEYFIDLLNQISSGELENACVIDLRELKNDEILDDYDSGHIHGSLSYDFNKQNKEKFITWITGLYNKKATILIVDSGNHQYKTIVEYLKEAGYQKIISYTKGYQQLKQHEKFKIIEESTGTEDCGC